MPSRNELVIRGNAVGLTAANYPNDSKFEQKILFLEKNGTTYTETKGTGVFTIAGADVTAGDTITVGNRVYTFRATALTGVKATGLITSDATAPSAGDTVSIEGVTYTFQTALSNPAQRNEVLIGGSAAAALDNLKIAINASGGTIGTEYSLGTTAHPLVTATTNTNTTQVVEAREYGTAANKFRLSETSSHLAWGSSFMGTVVTTEVAGVANVPDEILIQASAAVTLDVLKEAINGTTSSAVLGTDYSYGTYAHTEVTATTNTATAQTVEARHGAFDNAKIAISATGSGNIAAGAATLASGVRGVIVVDAAASAGVSGDKNVV